MDLKWTSKAQSDLARLFDFLASTNRPVAAKTIQSLVAAPLQLLDYPRIGEKLDEFEPRDVRRILAGPYEIRYELTDPTIFILRVWHGREER